MALLLPFLMVLFLGAVDFGRAYYYTQTLQNCADSAVLYASGTARRNPGTTTSPEDAAAQAAVAGGSSLNPPLSAQGVAVSSSGGSATVTVTYGFAMLSRYLGFPSTLTISRSATMAVAPQPFQ
jgi:Flp pilus assembly protein TadG